MQEKLHLYRHEPAIQPYLHALTHLKRAPTRYSTAPHKPVLVLTLLELIAKGTVVNNKLLDTYFPECKAYSLAAIFSTVYVSTTNRTVLP